MKVSKSNTPSIPSIPSKVQPVQRVTAFDLNRELDALKADDDRDARDQREGLYARIERYYAVLHKVKSDPDQLECLYDRLKRMQIKPRKNAPLASLVVRAALGKKHKRLDAYSKTLQVADTKDIAPAGLAQWIEQNNGIEAVRRSQKVTQSDRPIKAQVQMDAAFGSLDGCGPIGAQFNVNLSALPRQGFQNDLSVVILRHELDGLTSVVHTFQDDQAVEDVYAAAEREMLRASKQQEIAAKLAKPKVEYVPNPLQH